ncbi:uncharacterized protein LOC111136409 [Crassostrea virginica]
MPRKAVGKKRGKYVASYSKETLQRAIEAIQNENMSFRKAEKTFHVPKSTLENHVSGKYDLNSRMGRKPALPEAVESKIVETLKHAAKQGIGVSRTQLLRRTGELCKRLRVTPFKGIQPSKDWWTGLKKRHPELTIRRSEKLSSSRARMMNPVVVDKYFTDLEQIVKDLNLEMKPHCIWNMDETGRSFEHTPVRVISDKKIRNVVGKTSNSRSNVTITACVNAMGHWMPPMFVVKGKTSASLHGFNTEAAPVGSIWSYQENGWMTDVLGEKWFKNVFLKECGPERPQLLILDGHSSHESLAILECALANNVQILSLPPHTTHILQPLDRAVFGPFSAAYNAACSEFMSENPLNMVNKWSFPGLIKIAWEKSFTEHNIQSGFQACGIYPLNKHVIPASGFAPSFPTDVPESQSPASSSAIMSTPESINLFPATVAISVPSVSSDDVRSSLVSISHKSPVSSTSTSAESRESVSATDIMTLSNSDTSNFPTTSDISTNNIDNSEPPMIDDPELLLNLIATGQINVVENENEIPEENTGIWNSEIENIFLTPKAKPETKSCSTNRKKRATCTSHRLLTSTEVLQEKRDTENKKQEKLKLKLEREEKRKQKMK